jgi:hypothetical protein
MHRDASKVSHAALVLYAEDVIGEALRSGAVEPMTAIKCVSYASDPDLMNAVRLFAALTELERQQVLAFARSVSRSQPYAFG